MSAHAYMHVSEYMFADHVHVGTMQVYRVLEYNGTGVGVCCERLSEH